MVIMIGKSLGRYHILEQIGEGGMATVYKAFDTRLEAEVAVKVIRTDNILPNVLERALKRFEREAKALARLNHLNIVNVTDYGDYEGQPYLVMPYLQGGTLKEMLKGKAMDWQEASQMLIPIANALGYAHQREMIHRDVKPSNILITETGEPLLTDFGVAKIIDDEVTMDLTGTHATVGTPEYMSPEQVTAKNVDHRADIYALGVVFYEMVTGRRPFQADTPMAVLFKHASEPLPRPTKFVPKLPKNVEQILLKALAKDADNRYQSMGEFVVALEKLTIRSARQAKPKRKEKTVKVVPQKISKSSQGQKGSKVLWFVLGGVALVSILLGWVLKGGPATIFPSKTPTLISTPIKTSTPISTPTLHVTSTPVSTATPTLGLGSSWERPADGMVMMYIPEGEFQMGSNYGESDEQPVHTVYLDAFWIDQTEVTKVFYKMCVSAGTCRVTKKMEETSNNNPIAYVNWNDAQTYCKWVGARLPTEAEWEKAARGGRDGFVFPWGDTSPTCQVGSTSGAQTGNCGRAISVQSFAPNGYGLYDVSGNVWEWVNDWYDPNFYSTTPANNPIGPSSGDGRVHRGGSWFLGEVYARVANRQGGDSDGQGYYFDMGFRCARSANLQE